MNEYACWLQNRRPNAADRRNIPCTILAEGGDAITIQAADELRRGFI
jgi:hypothetical protein